MARGREAADADWAERSDVKVSSPIRNKSISDCNMPLCGMWATAGDGFVSNWRKNSALRRSCTLWATWHHAIAIYCMRERLMHCGHVIMMHCHASKNADPISPWGQSPGTRLPHLFHLMVWCALIRLMCTCTWVHACAKLHAWWTSCGFVYYYINMHMHFFYLCNNILILK